MLIPADAVLQQKPIFSATISSNKKLSGQQEYRPESFVLAFSKTIIDDDFSNDVNRHDYLL
jgi:hypothetical protein